MNKKETGIVFFIGDMSQSGGTERVLSVVANGLAERGYRVSIMSLWGKGVSFFWLDKRIKVYWIGKENPGNHIIKNLSLLSGALKSEDADFLIDVDLILGFYSFILKNMVQGMHWISWEHFNYFYHFHKNRLLRKAARWIVSRFSEQLIVLTDEDKYSYQSNMRLKCKIARIYDPNPFPGQYLEKDAIRLPMVFAAGRLTAEKGFDLLIQSWKLLESRYPQWMLVIAGEGKDRGILEKEISSAGLKRVRLTGIVSRIEEYYKRAAFFVLPSRDEGFGMVLIEAMFFSLPTVSYSCKAGPKEIITDGEDGFLVEPGQVVEFAGKMELLMQDENLRRRMGENAAKSIRRFDAEGILDQWEALLGQF